MADDAKTSSQTAKSTLTEAPGEHYEEVAEYRVGEGAPPLALIVFFLLVVLWAMTSWIPFFGY